MRKGPEYPAVIIPVTTQHYVMVAKQKGSIAGEAIDLGDDQRRAPGPACGERRRELGAVVASA